MSYLLGNCTALQALNLALTPAKRNRWFWVFYRKGEIEMACFLRLGLSFHILLVASLLLGVGSTAPAVANPVLPPQFEAVQLPGSFNLPTAFTFALDGTAFVAEKFGIVRVVREEAAQSVPFIDLRGEVNRAGDSGLTAIALHPGFVPDGGPTSWAYLLYTVSPVPGENYWGYNQDQKFGYSRLARFKAVTQNGNIVADMTTQQNLLGNPGPDGVVRDSMGSISLIHSTAHMIFAPDGSLLVTAGDAAHAEYADLGGNDPAAFETFIHPETGKPGPMPDYEDSGAFRVQDLRSLSGKILRLNPETGQGYSTNPYFDGDPSSNASRIWALGFRNPWRISVAPGTGGVHPSQGNPGVLFVGDVGWVQWEEINVCRGGENFQWPFYEGQGFIAQLGPERYINHRFGEDDPLQRPDFSRPGPGASTHPIFAYNRWDGVQPIGSYRDEDGNNLGGFSGASITGGEHYTGSSYPELYQGRYFFSDYTRGFLKTLETDANHNLIAVRPFAENLGTIVDIQANPVTADLHYITIAPGRLYRLQYNPAEPPAAIISATPTFGDTPLLVDFSAEGSTDPGGDTNLTYTWDFGDGSPEATGLTTTHTFQSNGSYTVTLTVTNSSGISGQASTVITVGPTPPVATITSPAFGSLWQPGTPISASCVGSDIQDQEELLEYSWTLDLYKDGDITAGVAQWQGRDIQFQPAAHLGSTYAWRLNLTVTDMGGMSGIDHVWIYPQGAVHDVTVATKAFARITGQPEPGPTGEGMNLPELFKDGDMPPVGSAYPARQYDSFFTGDFLNDQWAGLTLQFEAPEAARFVGLTFQEGMHFGRGGWWSDFGVEVLSCGQWNPVSSLNVTPDYPFQLADRPGFNGVNFETYELRFDPVSGEAIRLRGTPGGTHSFFSAAEIRALMLDESSPVKTCASVGSGKTLPDGSWVEVKDPVVVTLSTQDGYFYAQALDGSSGIRVQPVGWMPQLGQAVTLSGLLGKTAQGERVLKYAMVSSAGIAAPTVWKLNAREVGGAGFIGPTGSFLLEDGLLNEGLLVKVAGYVRGHGLDGSFFLEDGSRVWAGPGSTGLKVTQAGQTPEVGSFVSVIGVVTRELADGLPIRVIQGRSGTVPTDIEVILNPE